jgi:hypothetical protein
MRYRWTTVGGGTGKEFARVTLAPIQGATDNRILPDVDLVFMSIAELAELTNFLTGYMVAKNSLLKRPYAEVQITTVTRHRRAKKVKPLGVGVTR